LPMIPNSTGARSFSKDAIVLQAWYAGLRVFPSGQGRN
jgi:hypothetical protein